MQNPETGELKVCVFEELLFVYGIWEALGELVPKLKCEIEDEVLDAFELAYDRGHDDLADLLKRSARVQKLVDQGNSVTRKQLNRTQVNQSPMGNQHHRDRARVAFDVAMDMLRFLDARLSGI